PNAGAGRCAIFKIFQSATVGKANENDFATAAADFLNKLGNVMEALFNRLAHLFPKLFFRNVSGRRWRREKRNPDLLNCSSQFAARSRAYFDHAGATFAINRSAIWRQTRRNLRVSAIRT